MRSRQILENYFIKTHLKQPLAHTSTNNTIFLYYTTTKNNTYGILGSLRNDSCSQEDLQLLKTCSKRQVRIEIKII